MSAYPKDAVSILDWNELHKKIGQIVVLEENESHITQLWFIESSGKMYLLAEKE